jgi:hypothetical protein
MCGRFVQTYVSQLSTAQELSGSHEPRESSELPQCDLLVLCITLSYLQTVTTLRSYRIPKKPPISKVPFSDEAKKISRQCAQFSAFGSLHYGNTKI